VTAFELTAIAPRKSASASRIRILCALFFFSGFPALIYQLTWQRSLFRVFGVNTESVTIVVTAFMLGLGIGSIAGGWITRRRKINALLLLGVIELSTAIFGIASLAIFEFVGRLVLHWPLPVVAVVNLLLILLPTLLMGATLPILVSHLVRTSGQTGAAVSTLYYVNTMGAGVACLLCAILIFPHTGMHAAIWIAAGINVVVGTGALVARSRYREHAVEDSPSRAVPIEPPVFSMPFAMALAAFGGFISLSYEIFLFRTASFASGSSAFAFALTLAAFLMGVASGSHEAADVCARQAPRDAMRKAIVSLVWANVFAAMFLPLITQFASMAVALIGITLVTIYLIARQWGGLLPYLSQLSIAADDRAGMRTALLYFSNIVGCATGSVLTGFVLTNFFGLHGIAILLLCAGTLCVMLMIAKLDVPLREKLRRSATATAVLAIAAILILSAANRLLENLQYKRISDHAFADVVQNRDGIITVDTDGTVFGNGAYDGRFNIDLEHDRNGIIRPYALSLFHPAPRDVLMIGLASGSWAQVIANNPAVASFTIVEINPGYAQLIARQSEVQSILHNPKVRIIKDDGRRWLNRHPEARFDAIVSNTTWNFRANATNLLSTEFLGLAKQHLNHGGIVFYNTTNSARVQRTGCLAFPFGARFTNHMVLSESPMSWDFARWRGVLENYTIDGKPMFNMADAKDRAAIDDILHEYGPGSPEIEDCRTLLSRTAGMTPVTDDNMGTEWRYYLGLK
jgi:spermidine synthase